MAKSTQSFPASKILERAMGKIEAALHSEKTHGNRYDIDESTSLNDVKAPNLFERAKEEVDALVEVIRHKKESLTNEDRDGSAESRSKSENPGTEVIVHNLIEKAKEKIEGVTRHEGKEVMIQNLVGKAREKTQGMKHHKGTEVSIHNLIEKAKGKIEGMKHHEQSPKHHHTETHGRSEDIDENTPVNEVKGPSVFERAKEELEALVETIQPKKESSEFVPSPEEEKGFWSSIGRWLEKVCSPFKIKRD